MFLLTQKIGANIFFAPIGLLDMFNSGGAVEHFEVQETEATTITLKVRGCGRFGFYSSQQPLKCIVGNVETGFDYDVATGLATLTIPVPEEEMYRWAIEIQV